MNKKRLNVRQRLSVQVAKNPSRVILLGIILINLIFICFAALVVRLLAPDYIAQRGFFAALFYTISMIMDAGCISYVVEDIGTTQGVLVIVCVVIVLIGMIFFTGGIIGYVSNAIASFIDNSNAGRRALKITAHTVVLNWNSRASEIINDLLYCDTKEIVVVLVGGNREKVQIEIENRLAETIAEENRMLAESCQDKQLIQRVLYMRKHRFKRNVTVIVREGNTYSSKQLLDISVDKAKSVIILNQEHNNDQCKYAADVRNQHDGDAQTVKTLVLVAEITSKESSADNQKIIVEVEDEWTDGLVKKIIREKEKLGKCNIVPVAVNKVLGSLLAQFSIMPELNMVYNELFSNKGAEFFAAPDDPTKRKDEDVAGYMANHYEAVPLTLMDTKVGKYMFFMADHEFCLSRGAEAEDVHYTVKERLNYRQPRRNILILGHNSKVTALMEGFDSYRNEWNPAEDGRDILNITVIDDAHGLEAINYYKDYSYVNQVIEAELYQQDLIYDAIDRFIDDQDGDTAILILSDDMVSIDDLDSNALTYLIYVQDMLAQRRERTGGVDSERIDIVIEILNPQNFDVAKSYSARNVVISNRYISKMITQIGEKEVLFEFYNDILVYDDGESDVYTSKELYIKKVSDFFEEVPDPCTAAELIRAVYNEYKKQDPGNVAIVLGYITDHEKMIIFEGDQREIQIALKITDKLILFSNH